MPIRENRPASVYVRLPLYQVKGLDRLVSIGVHRNRVEAIRSAVERYLLFFQDGEGEKTLSGLTKLKALAASKERYENVERWMADAGDMLAEAVGIEDLALVKEIYSAASSAFYELPITYQATIKSEIRQNPAWYLAATMLDKKRFWMEEEDTPSNDS